ncbi:MAG: septal ring lytic transglycosylase RlpA family protein [Thermostichales cyanobacterium BF4_bins_65]
MGNYRLLSGMLLSGLALGMPAWAAPSATWQAPSLAPAETALPVPAEAPLTKAVSADLTQARVMPAALGSLSPVLKVGTWQRDSQETSVTTLYEHRMDGQVSTTLYLRDLPLVTFVERPNQPSPLLQASSLAAQLNQLARSHAGAQTVDLVYRDDRYVITHNGEEFLRFDDSILTMGKDQASVALMVTNRMRRLLLNAPPLAAAPLPPQPSPLQQAVSTLVGMVPVQEQRGQASFYTFAPRSKTHGAMTAAHRSLPFGTLVRVTNLTNGRATVVKINDRGPFIPGRIIDLSFAAAQAIGMVQAGVVPVKVEVLRPN